MKIKKRERFLFVIVLFSLLGILIIGPKIISFIGESIFDAQATADSLTMKINIDSTPPNVIIHYPQNTTYNRFGDILLNITAYDEMSFVSMRWYNLDNITTNYSIPYYNNITIYVSGQGDHIIRVYVQDSLGFVNDSETVSFNVNTSIGYIVNTTTYTGNTTVFENLTTIEQENISDLCLEKPGYGKVKFKETINLSDDGKWFEDQPVRVFDFDSNTQITYNKIFINTTEMPQLNKPATLQLEDLNFTNPRILKDGVVCSDCVIEEYSNGTLVFNVTSFSEYTVEETPVETPSTPSTGSPGGGGGGGSSRGLFTKEINMSEGTLEKIYEDLHKPGNLFDIRILIPQKYTELYKGDNLVLEVTALDLGGNNKIVDVLIEYEIIDYNGTSKWKFVETKAIDETLTFIKTITLPENFGEGNYVVYVKLKYGKDVAEAGYPFNYYDHELNENLQNSPLGLFGESLIYLIIILAIIILFIVFICYEHKKFKQISKMAKRADIRRMKKLRR
ncbi:MAG: hypothetical protein PHE43_00685 [Candidatus Nanoarchaeia archaeon]|nr:hypothetical protein [Candidatus Nanoarchaeia archaeon]